MFCCIEKVSESLGAYKNDGDQYAEDNEDYVSKYLGMVVTDAHECKYSRFDSSLFFW